VTHPSATAQAVPITALPPPAAAAPLHCFPSPGSLPPWLVMDMVIADGPAWSQNRRVQWRRETDRLVAAGLHPDFRIVHGGQTHGDGVAVVDPDHPLLRAAGPRAVISLPQTDAIIVTAPDTVAVIVTADCVPAMVWDAATPRAALAHAGWRGTYHRILAKALRRMIALGSRPQDLRVWLGPSICGRHYEVDDALAGRFAAAFPEATSIAVPQYRRLDLPALNAWQARSMGLAAEQVTGCGVCVFEDARLPSWRRERDAAGRLLTRVALAGV